MADAQKPTITFGGVKLAATGALGWRFTTGTRPNVATFQCYRLDWDANLRQKIGQEFELVIQDSRGQEVRIKRLTLLHEVPSSGPNLRSFAVADLRWRWQYPLICRDYNVPKKTGDRTAVENTPFPGFVTIDQYDYKGYSLDGGDTVWTAEAALRDVLEQLRDEGETFAYSIDSFPIIEQSGVARDFVLQNAVLRDQGDVALARLMAYIPGATLWVDAEGTVRIIDGADLSDAEAYFRSLPGATWDGERAVMVERKAIRPPRVVVHYQREVEVLLEYSDDYGGTVSQPSFSRPYIENVIQTVDDSTTVSEYDPILKQTITKTVPPGTWVNFRSWLSAMDDDRPANSGPWTFDTIKKHWVAGDLDGALGAGGLDYDDSANVSMRVQAIKQHFRQSFRINRRLMDRTRNLENVSAQLLDAYTGARAPSRVWGQATIIPSTKGKMVIGRKDPARAFVYRAVDYYAPTQGAFSGRTIEAPHGPTRVNIVDRDLGIFRLDWVLSPYGTEQAFIPSLMQDEDGDYNVPQLNLEKQDDEPMGAGFKIESGTNSIFLADSMQYRVLLTFTPGAPNNKLQFHRETVEAGDVDAFTAGDWRIGSGEGPELHVFVTPSEATARFAWQDDTTAAATVGSLFGIDEDDPVLAGYAGDELPGYVLTNQERELRSHSRAVAAEAYAAFADSIQGRVATVIPDNGVRLSGNMSGATVAAAAAPSGKVMAMHEFPGIQKPISRLALMDEGARQVVLGIVRFSGGDS